MFVYVIASEGGMCKIGKARDPHERVKDLSTGHPFPIMLAAKIACETDAQAYDVEARAHWALDGQRMAGEWFRVGMVEAVALLRHVAAEPLSFPHRPRAPDLTSADRQRAFRERRAAKLARAGRLEAFARDVTSYLATRMDPDGKRLHALAQEALS